MAEDVELADSVSMAMLLVLETLAPTERAVFVLREVFALGYDEIAEAVDKEPGSGPPDRPPGAGPRRRAPARGAASAAETRRTVEAFRQAVATGDLQRLLDILAPDVVLLTDGGGVVQAAPAPVVGADQVAHVLGRVAAAMSLEPAQVNGDPALIVRLGGEIDTVMAMRIDDGVVTGLYAVRNPEKLSRLDRETALRR